MILLLLLLLIVFLLLGILVKIGHKPQYRWNHGDFHNAGVRRVIYGIFFLVIGIAAPPLWLLTVLMFISAWVCFRQAKA